MTIRDLSSLEVGKVVELNRSAKKPLDLLANGKIFARGDLVMVGDNNDRLGLRITELIGMPTEEEG